MGELHTVFAALKTIRENTLIPKALTFAYQKLEYMVLIQLSKLMARTG